ncbi:Pentatricopeptide repeat [Macleaya cordata]|uniref:Pentatricopeptide repeat n=1 Tax=Macleaya cordata TaxID=56857 RepID=A0A200Q282_MACCD|nr:Pentatricopeptide repeat [Macleaya cordata]
MQHLMRYVVFFTTTNSSRYFSTSNTVANRVSLYLQRARLIDSIRLALRSNSPPSLLPLLNDPALDSFVVTHALRSAPSPDSALSLLDTLKTIIPNFSPSQPTLHAIAKILAKSKRISELQTLIDSINAGEFTNVARVGFMDLLRWNTIVGDLESAVRVWNDYRLVLSESKKHPCTESYNLLISLYAQKSKDLEAVQMFSRMINEGANPNSRTYTVVIDHLASSGRLEAALQVFDILPFMRIKRTLRQYSILTELFTKIERFDVVKTLLKEMKKDGILPGHSMRISLNCMRDAGYLEETEDFVSELLPDERIGSVGFAVDNSDDEDEIEDEGDGSEIDGNGVQLKPWLDPSALASALSDWNPNEVSALEDAKFVWTTRLVCKVLRSFKKAETAWKFFWWVAYQPGDFTHDVHTVSRMIAILARHGHVELLDQLISKVKREGIQLSFSTVRLIIDFYGISKKPDAALKVFGDVESITGPISKSNLMLLYSSLFRMLVKCKRGLDAMDLLEEMILSEILPDIQTFTGLMQHFALEGDLRTVQRLFGMVRQSGLDPDAYMFRILIRAYCKSERAALALRVFEDMRNLDLMPDAATKALLVKSLWKEGRLREAAAVEEKTEEINDMLQLALPGHVWTVSAADLTRVYHIYSNSFATNGG